MTEAVPIYVDALKRGLRPDARLTVSEWADQRRWLSTKSSAEPGQWRTERTPYLREVMDELSAASHTEEVVMMCGAQLGKTETGNNWVGYTMDVNPCPMMALQPTVDMAKRYSKQRLVPLIDETPTLKGKVKPARARDSGNTTLMKEFSGGVLVITGANSAVGLRSMPVRNLFVDEEDAYPLNVDGEGDPVELARARTRTFARRKIFRVSTPTIKGRSRIEKAFDESDQRHFYVPCPHCQEFQVLRFTQLKWPDGEPEQAKYECEHCEVLIENHEKTWMLERGEWRKHNPDSQVAGFHLSSLYSPVGWFSWAEAAQMFMKAQEKPDLLRVFVNTVLGEVWKDMGEAPEWRVLFERREAYPLGKAPMPVLFLTAGIDVQKDRLEIQVVGWGADKQSWLVDYEVLMGDTSRPDVWVELTAYVERSWEHESGISLPLTRWAIDSGYATQDVYQWARTQTPGQCLVVKGFEHGVAPIGQPNAVEVTVGGRRYKRGVKVWPVATGLLKSELYRWLKLDKPTNETEVYPPGYCHFPQIGEEFFKQIAAEQLVEKSVKGGFKKLEWQKLRDRNEALDTRVYARAAAAQFGLDRFDERRWQQLRESIDLAVATETEAKASVIASSPAKPAAGTPWRPKPIVSDDPYS